MRVTTPTTENTTSPLTSSGGDINSNKKNVNETSKPEKDESVSQPVMKDTKPSNAVTGAVTSGTENEDKEVKSNTDVLKAEVEKLEWQKHNFDAFDGTKVRGISGS